MNKIVTFLATILLLSSCDNSRRIKTIVELTPKLEQVKEAKIIIQNSVFSEFDTSLLKSKAYTISKNSISSEPLIFANIAFTTDILGVIYAFSIKDKKLSWSYNSSSDNRKNYNIGGLAHRDGKLYITNGSKYLIILDAANGHEIIRKEFPDIIKTKPVILSPNLVFIQTVSNQSFIIDINNFNIMWKNENMNSMLQNSYYFTPIIHNNLLIIHYTTGEILAINSNEGSINWSINLSDLTNMVVPSFEINTISCKPILHDSHMYIATTNGNLLKLNLANGSIIWKIDASDILNMSLYGDNLFVVNNGRQVAAIDIKNGMTKFVGDLSDPKEKNLNIKTEFFFEPILTKIDDKIFLYVVGNKGELYKFQYEKDNFNHLPKFEKITNNIRYMNIMNNIIFTDKHIVVK